MSRNLENLSIPEEKIKEYNFAEGLKELERIIDEKLKNKDCVVVVFNATGINVGKTYLSSRLKRDLTEKGIPSLLCGNLNAISSNGEIGFLADLESSGQKKGVIILEAQFGDFVTYESNAEAFRGQFSNEINKKIGQEFKPDQIDVLFLGLRRPDRQFPNESSGKKLFPLADLIINNELAFNDPSKYGFNKVSK